MERQIEVLRRCGIDDIIVVKGYAAQRIDLPDIRYYVNEEYAHTNMVYSLFCAEPELEGDVIVSYADILFERRILDTLLQATYDISVVADLLWEEYYRARFQDPFREAESFVYDSGGRILDIGRGQPAPSDVQAQYIGLIKLSSKGSRIFREMYHRTRHQYWDKYWLRGRIFQKAYMTDFLQALIDEGVPVYAILVKHGWLEFDTVADYEQVIKWYADGVLERFYSLRSQQE